MVSRLILINSKKEMRKLPPKGGSFIFKIESLCYTLNSGNYIHPWLKDYFNMEEKNAKRIGRVFVYFFCTYL